FVGKLNGLNQPQLVAAGASAVVTTLSDGTGINEFYGAVSGLPGGVLTVGNNSALGVGGAVSEVQQVTAGAGSFSLTFNGRSTPTTLSASSTALDVQHALEALSTIGMGNVSVTQAGNVFTITFLGDRAGF